MPPEGLDGTGCEDRNSQPFSEFAAWHGSDDMATRARRAGLAKFDELMARVPDVPPVSGDEIK